MITGTCFSAHMMCTPVTMLLKCFKIEFSLTSLFCCYFTFLFSSLAIIALLEDKNQCCDNITHHYHLPKSVLTTKLCKNSQSFRIFPKIPNTPTKFPIFPVEIYHSQNSQEFCIPTQGLSKCVLMLVQYRIYQFLKKTHLLKFWYFSIL